MKRISLISTFILISGFIFCQTNQELTKHYLSFASGTIVKSSSGNCVFDYNFLESSSVAYDEQIIGIIKPDLSYNNPRIIEKPIVNEGSALVRFNFSNGQIKKGDPITSSEVPGEAMKATQSGMIIGIALEDAKSNSGLIKVRVLIQYLNF